MSVVSPLWGPNSVMSPAPLNPSWVLTGDPQPRGYVTQVTRDSTAGFWDCNRGKFYWHYGRDEAVCILEGAVAVRRVGDTLNETLYLGPGASMTFKAGTTYIWTVDVYVHKFFVESHAGRSWWRRLERRLSRIFR